MEASHHTAPFGLTLFEKQVGQAFFFLIRT